MYEPGLAMAKNWASKRELHVMPLRESITPLSPWICHCTGSRSAKSLAVLIMYCSTVVGITNVY